MPNFPELTNRETYQVFELKWLTMMKAVFHNKTFDLLKIQPKFSQHAEQMLAQVESQQNIMLPRALREWYLLEDNDRIFKKITFMHDPVELEELRPEMYSKTSPGMRLIRFLFENQGVWHMAVPLNAGDNPPVYIGYYDDCFDWKLHAHSFSDCIEAFAWDFTILQHKHLIDNYKEIEEDVFRKEKARCVKGPATFIASAHFVCNRFFRYQNEKERVLCLFGEKGTMTLVVGAIT